MPRISFRRGLAFLSNRGAQASPGIEVDGVLINPTGGAAGDVLTDNGFGTITPRSLPAAPSTNPLAPPATTGNGTNQAVRGGASTDATGGNLVLEGGEPGGASSDGGYVFLRPHAGNAPDGNAGSLVGSGGTSAGAGNGGDVVLFGGQANGAGTAGTVELTAGFSVGGTHGRVSLRDSAGNVLAQIGPTQGTMGFYGHGPVTQPAHINDPAGGATVDAEARATIVALLNLVEALGLMGT